MISWTIHKSFAPRSRQMATPVPHHSTFYRPDALPDNQPTASKHWRTLRWWWTLKVHSHVTTNTKTRPAGTETSQTGD